MGRGYGRTGLEGRGKGKGRGGGGEGNVFEGFLRYKDGITNAMITRRAKEMAGKEDNNEDEDVEDSKRNGSDELETHKLGTSEDEFDDDDSSSGNSLNSHNGMGDESEMGGYSNSSSNSLHGLNPTFTPIGSPRYVVVEVAPLNSPWHRRNVKVPRSWRDKLATLVVQTLDARDYAGRWREGRVVKIDQGKVRIDYVGFKGGSWYDCDSRDLAPKGSFVTGKTAGKDKGMGGTRSSKGGRGGRMGGRRRETGNNKNGTVMRDWRTDKINKGRGIGKRGGRRGGGDGEGTRYARGRRKHFPDIAKGFFGGRNTQVYDRIN
jgi:hypothetical protein